MRRRAEPYIDLYRLELRRQERRKLKSVHRVKIFFQVTAPLRKIGLRPGDMVLAKACPEIKLGRLMALEVRGVLRIGRVFQEDPMTLRFEDGDGRVEFLDPWAQVRAHGIVQLSSVVRRGRRFGPAGAIAGCMG